MKTHDTKTLPKWVQKHIEELEKRVLRAERTLPWTKPGMEWFTILHPNMRSAADQDRHRKLFLLGEDYAQPVCSVGPQDCVIVGRGRHPLSKSTAAQNQKPE